MNKNVVLAVLLLCANLAALDSDLTLSTIKFGNVRTVHNARSLAMGGSGIAGGYAVHSAMLNPALITAHAHAAEFSALGLVYNLEEDRSFPYYDNFGGFVDYGTYVFNSNTYADFTLNAIVLLPFLNNHNINFGLGYNTLLNYNYDYLEEVRSDAFGDALLAYNKIISEGQFKEVSFVLGADLIPGVAAGVKLGLITGSITQKVEVVAVDEDISGLANREDNDVSLDGMPVNVNIGLHYRYDEHFAIASVIRFPYTIETTNSHILNTNADGNPVGALAPFNYSPVYTAGTSGFDSTATKDFARTQKYPLSLGLGLDYRFTNVLEARIHADFEYTFWSNFSDSFTPGIKFSDTYRIRLGVEHIFFDKMPFRVGFSYQPLKENRRYTRSILTAGVGILFPGVEVDLSGGIENLTTIQADLFDDGNYPPLESRLDTNDRVQSNYLYGMVEFRFWLNDIW
jgi:long-subunit fatty acid transport protein